MSTWFESCTTMASSTLRMLNIDLVCNLINFFSSSKASITKFRHVTFFIHLKEKEKEKCQGTTRIQWHEPILSPMDPQMHFSKPNQINCFKNPTIYFLILIHI